MLNKKMLEDAGKNNCSACNDCKMIDFEGMESCIKRLSQTALAYRAMLERLEWGGVADWGMEEAGCPWCHEQEKYGHKPDCELAALLRESEVEK